MVPGADLQLERVADGETEGREKSFHSTSSYFRM